jgi:tripartite-type tricarboxylate transporter receptor subunit TctC
LLTDFIHIQQVHAGPNVPVVNAILANEIPTMFINQDVALPHIKAGKLRAIAVTSLSRNPLYPDVPTVSEARYFGFQALSWSACLCPSPSSTSWRPP